MPTKENLSLLFSDFPEKSEIENIKKEKIGRIKIIESKAKKEKILSIFFPFPFSVSEENDIKENFKKGILSFLPNDIKKVLVVGIGNRSITADSLGPTCAEKIIPTRKLSSSERFELSVIKTGVFAQTGIFTFEFIEAISEKIEAQCVILIDSLAAKSTKRLYKTLQIANTGILPGSAVKSRGRKIDSKNLGVPVISIGVPTVVDVKVLAAELTGKEIRGQQDMIVTPATADVCIEKLSSVIADSINEICFGF